MPTIKNTILAFMLVAVGACAAGDTGFTNVVASGNITAASGTVSAEQITTTDDMTVTDDLTVTGLATVGETLGVTGLTTSTGGTIQTPLTVTGTATLTTADCGQTIFVTAGIDTKTITLPATVAGCTYKFVYTGADGGALLDISPNASDAVHGSCTLAASVLELSGSDDADFGFTKATINTGDTVTITGDGSVGWFIEACAGILANN